MERRVAHEPASCHTQAAIGQVASDDACVMPRQRTHHHSMLADPVGQYSTWSSMQGGTVTTIRQQRYGCGTNKQETTQRLVHTALAQSPSTPAGTASKCCRRCGTTYACMPKPHSPSCPQPLSPLLFTDPAFSPACMHVCLAAPMLWVSAAAVSTQPKNTQSHTCGCCAAWTRLFSGTRAVRRKACMPAILKVQKTLRCPSLENSWCRHASFHHSLELTYQ
jgi:hypothetical protein